MEAVGRLLGSTLAVATFVHDMEGLAASSNLSPEIKNRMLSAIYSHAYSALTRVGNREIYAALSGAIDYDSGLEITETGSYSLAQWIGQMSSMAINSRGQLTYMINGSTVVVGTRGEVTVNDTITFTMAQLEREYVYHHLQRPDLGSPDTPYTLPADWFYIIAVSNWPGAEGQETVPASGSATAVAN